MDPSVSLFRFSAFAIAFPQVLKFLDGDHSIVSHRYFDNCNSKRTAVNINSYSSLIVLLNLKILSEIDNDNIATILLM